jgi:hypothetical protein
MRKQGSTRSRSGSRLRNRRAVPSERPCPVARSSVGIRSRAPRHRRGSAGEWNVRRGTFRSQSARPNAEMSPERTILEGQRPGGGVLIGWCRLLECPGGRREGFSSGRAVSSNHESWSGESAAGSTIERPVSRADAPIRPTMASWSGESTPFGDVSLTHDSWFDESTETARHARQPERATSRERANDPSATGRSRFVMSGRSVIPDRIRRKIHRGVRKVGHHRVPAAVSGR